MVSCRLHESLRGPAIPAIALAGALIACAQFRIAYDRLTLDSPMIENIKAVMAGLVPAIHESADPVVKIVLFGVYREDKAHFPGPSPMLHIVLPLDRCLDIRVAFGVYEPFQPVALRKAIDETLAMLPCAAGKVTGHPRVEDAVRAIGHHIDPRVLHLRTLSEHRSLGNAPVDGRDKPGHDAEGVAAGYCIVYGGGSFHQCSAKS